MEANVMNILGEDPVTVVDAALVIRYHFIRSVCSLDSEHLGMMRRNCIAAPGHRWFR